jgi:hypothetical protein
MTVIGHLNFRKFATESSETHNENFMASSTGSLMKHLSESHQVIDAKPYLVNSLHQKTMMALHY